MAQHRNLGHATAYAYAKAHGYTGTEEEFAELMASYAEVAEEAKGYSKDAEAWSDGKRDGVDVDNTDPAYHNNAKWHADQAAISKNAASASETAAGQSASAAAASATSAGTAKTDAEAAAEAAEASAEAAASVFAVVGNVAFSVLPNGQVRETWTEEESE